VASSLMEVSSLLLSPELELVVVVAAAAAAVELPEVAAGVAVGALVVVGVGTRGVAVSSAVADESPVTDGLLSALVASAGKSKVGGKKALAVGSRAAAVGSKASSSLVSPSNSSAEKKSLLRSAAPASR